MRITRARGARSSTASAVPSAESLSTTISSSPSPSSGSRAGRVLVSSSRLFQATMRTESVGGTGAEAIRPSAPVPATSLLSRVRPYFFFFDFLHELMLSAYLLFLTCLPF